MYLIKEKLPNGSVVIVYSHTDLKSILNYLSSLKGAGRDVWYVKE